MPLYEAALIIRMMSKPDLVSTIKRAADNILNRGGILQKFQSSKTQQLPYTMIANDAKHKTGHYVFITFNAPPAVVEDVNDELQRDLDIIRGSILRVEKPSPFSCTLEEELQPPAYRKEVQEMLAEIEKKKKVFFKRNTPNLDYYPFQK
uniref:Small ribosomal subunit protein bS6m n=1 Tax=Lynceus sp. MCZ IZ 141354 TaxID=1930659 RepID=A0A9N6ZHH6_9CRUS|nr:EOG090X0IQO [Lynceus sp. MCZ IZ 141354]